MSYRPCQAPDGRAGGHGRRCRRTDLEHSAPAAFAVGQPDGALDCRVERGARLTAGFKAIRTSAWRAARVAEISMLGWCARGAYLLWVDRRRCAAFAPATRSHSGRAW